MLPKELSTYVSAILQSLMEFDKRFDKSHIKSTIVLVSNDAFQN